MYSPNMDDYVFDYTPPHIDWDWVGAHVATIGTIEPEALKVDGMDTALIGVVQQFNKHFLCYSMAKIIEILMDRDGMTELEALEFYNFNIVGAYMGEFTPVFLQDY
jgi:hypothetical protein